MWQKEGTPAMIVLGIDAKPTAGKE
jgi:hypothetical protein